MEGLIKVALSSSGGGDRVLDDRWALLRVSSLLYASLCLRRRLLLCFFLRVPNASAVNFRFRSTDSLRRGQSLEVATLEDGVFAPPQFCLFGAWVSVSADLRSVSPLLRVFSGRRVWALSDSVSPSLVWSGGEVRRSQQRVVVAGSVLFSSRAVVGLASGSFSCGCASGESEAVGTDVSRFEVAFLSGSSRCPILVLD
ncbi:hypothetical protein DY000_02026810 [Brassica cretica]|uniref:Uncharacterized protein n=1 Tax=Brassica cretica TaxID=69181 RepID=A0ABQ7E8D8_BRACR|nr:hypothetical protein DY000_02026810 [Brassica cretica]